MKGLSVSIRVVAVVVVALIIAAVVVTMGENFIGSLGDRGGKYSGGVLNESIINLLPLVVIKWRS
jgi:hypothetical protein